MVPIPPDRQALDDQLSQRFIALDPSGYFLIKLDRAADELVAEQEKFKAITEELEQTFAEMSGY